MLKRLLNSFMQMMAKEMRKRAAAEGEGLVATEEASEQPKKARMPKKTKYAMLLSYQGQRYFGMQNQNDDKTFPTIESHLLNAMREHNFITDINRADPYTFYFQRCARTDRSVSAVRQIVSMELPRNDDFLRDGPALLNALLPHDIRVFGIKRTTPSFHSQKSCDGRTYSYTTPTYAFAGCDEVTSDAYRISAERIAQINELLAVFSGTHNYFNYTARLEHDDQRCKRLVHSFKCDKPFLFMDPIHNREVEFITCYVHGQSFIMHQIRKMIGSVICVLRGFMYKSDLVRSFLRQRMDIPRAPGLGLLLEKVHFDQYEKRFAHTHGSLNHWGDEKEAELLEARDRLIVQRILREECETQSMMQWLSTLPMHQYILDPEDISGTNTSQLFVAGQNANAPSDVGDDDADVDDEEVAEQFDGAACRPVGDDDDGAMPSVVAGGEVEAEEEMITANSSGGTVEAATVEEEEDKEEPTKRMAAAGAN
ncbi:hypothetical protein GPALN_014464 [Globodera pallida]|nr:hypothetical protein GPALN_014464 [Globodera pallida]